MTLSINYNRNEHHICNNFNGLQGKFFPSRKLKSSFRISKSLFLGKQIEIVIQIEIENFANLNCAKQFGNNSVAYHGNFHFSFAMILKY